MHPDIRMTARPENLPDIEPSANREPEAVEVRKEGEPTACHNHVNVDHGEKGAAQLEHSDAEDKDLGWNEEAVDAPLALVGGSSNEELWTLIRRFNKQIFHVKSIRDATESSTC